ncbi:lasso peptide biosynthesis B2 protein [Croceicoccus pelagius]|uniref:Microcin J25-processing protein McjB C-terminal domain-containing protein n=1 Tax=Croceicoccus pelagius TaxID=1703341 RepID=A0A917DJ08_9SPHN|nr:lasso peptide biosynthesis B2 protein [Croceicoccus pelagius]GGD41048.1 hypothetical protein GCM10010989_13940 [Croceicoccus pelagius]
MTRVRLRALEAMALLLAARMIVRFVPLRRLGRILGKSEPYALRQDVGAVSAEDELAARQCAAAVRRAAFRLPGTLCLPQAIGLRWMMERRGMDSTVVVGIRPAGERGTAHDLHAWVELNGQTILGDSDGMHASLLQFRS